MAYYERLKSLGDEKFTKILNSLMRGEPAMRLARLMQSPPPTGWGEFSDMSEKTLTRQLNRLRIQAAEGMFGEEIAKTIKDGSTPNLTFLSNVSINALDRLEELSAIQRARVLALVEREKSLVKEGAPTIMSVATAATDAVVVGYRQLLLDIQKVRFDLGLDEFKGPIHGIHAKAATQTTTFPDGSSIQKQVFEAVTTIEQIFDARNIPQLIAR